MSVLGGRRILGGVWMVYIKYVPANSKTYPAGLKHLYWGQSFTLVTINQVPNFTWTCYMLACRALLGRKEVLRKNWDSSCEEEQEQALEESEKGDKNDSQALGHSLQAFIDSHMWQLSLKFLWTSGRWKVVAQLGQVPRKPRRINSGLK